MHNDCLIIGQKYMGKIFCLLITFTMKPKKFNFVTHENSFIIFFKYNCKTYCERNKMDTLRIDGILNYNITLRAEIIKKYFAVLIAVIFFLVAPKIV